jgi:hypothetical protein
MSDTFDPSRIPQLFSNHDDEIVQLFAQFLTEVWVTTPQEDLSKYQIPRGRLNSRFVNFLHWPPDTRDAAPFASFNEKSRSIRVVNAILPNAWDNYLWHDFYCKRANINDAFGRRRTNQQIYGNDPNLPLHRRLARALLEQSDAEVILVWGGVCRREFKEWYPHAGWKYGSGPEEYGAYENVLVGGKEVSLKLGVGGMLTNVYRGRWCSCLTLSISHAGRMRAFYALSRKYSRVSVLSSTRTSTWIS